MVRRARAELRLRVAKRFPVPDRDVTELGGAQDIGHEFLVSFRGIAFHDLGTDPGHRRPIPGGNDRVQARGLSGKRIGPRTIGQPARIEVVGEDRRDREDRGQRRPRGDREPRRFNREVRGANDEDERSEPRAPFDGRADSLPLDVLPPAIGAESVDENVSEEKPAPRPRRARRPRPAEGGDEIAPAA